MRAFRNGRGNLLMGRVLISIAIGRLNNLLRDCVSRLGLIRSLGMLRFGMNIIGIPTRSRKSKSYFPPKMLTKFDSS